LAHLPVEKTGTRNQQELQALMEIVIALDKGLCWFFNEMIFGLMIYKCSFWRNSKYPTYTESIIGLHYSMGQSSAHSGSSTL